MLNYYVIPLCVKLIYVMFNDKKKLEKKKKPYIQLFLSI